MALTASTWRCTSEILGAVDALTVHGTTQLFPLGHTVTCVDTGTTNRGEAEFIYWGGLDTTVAGTMVVLDGALTEIAVALSRGPVGVAMAATVTGEYGWYQIRGPAIVNSATMSDNAQVYLAATTLVDDSVVGGDMVFGCRTMGSTDTAQTLCMLMYPRVADTDDGSTQT